MLVTAYNSKFSIAIPFPLNVIEICLLSIYLNSTYIKMQGHEGKFSIYVHASKEKPVHVSHYFVGRDIHSEPVWGLAHYLNL